MATGRITAVKVARGFGFIIDTDGESRFFHRNDLAPELEWDARLRGERVEFDACQNTIGPAARNVRPAT